jgi:hypothetical protein
MNINKFLNEGQVKDIEGLLAGYLNALDFIMAEIYNLKIPFIDDPVDIK